MVCQLQLCSRVWVKALKIFFYILVFFSFDPAHAKNFNFEKAKWLYQKKAYLQAAKEAFYTGFKGDSLSDEANALIFLSLLNAQYPQMSSYFFIKSIHSKNPKVTLEVLKKSEKLMIQVGSELLENALFRLTSEKDYNEENKGAYFYVLGKKFLFEKKYEKSIAFLRKVSDKSFFFPYALFLLATAESLVNRNHEALLDFKQCAENALKINRLKNDHPPRLIQDLVWRCHLGEARTLYQMHEFIQAEHQYDKIPRKNQLWPRVLLEQAHTADALKEYNRSLGRLVSFKSPSLKWFFNAEIDILRAQSFLNLCLYTDADDVFQQFQKKYRSLSNDLKIFIQKNENQLEYFYHYGKRGLNHFSKSDHLIDQMMLSAIQDPYFLFLMDLEKKSLKEIEKLKQLSLFSSSEVQTFSSKKDFSRFLKLVLEWRKKTIEKFGGNFLKQGWLKEYENLIKNNEKMSIISLEIMEHKKNILMKKEKNSSLLRMRGADQIKIRKDQIFWDFNGEFWSDELGDYVFALDSEC